MGRASESKSQPGCPRCNKTMFTGIIEELGRVRACLKREGTWRLEIGAHAIFDGVTVGESVAVNGVCLTAVELGEGWCGFDVGPETISATNLRELSTDDPVNLERPLRLGAPVGGHLVSGHVDGVGIIRRVEADPDSLRMTIELPSAELEYYVIPKGSVAVDGVSLTVARLQEGGSFEVMVIPHTLRMTTLGEKREGARVNLEMDLIGKYVHRLLSKAGGLEPIEGRAGLIPR